MLNNLSPAELSAARTSALQQRTPPARAAEPAVAMPNDQVSLGKGLSQADQTAAAQDNAAHLGLVKNDTKGEGSSSDASTAVPASEVAKESPATTTQATTTEGQPSAATEKPAFQSGQAGATLSQSDPNAPTQPGSGSDPTTPTQPNPTQPNTDPRVQAAQAAASAKAEEDQVRAIFMQMWADSRKAQADMWKIVQDTNQKIFEIIEGVAVNRAMTVQKSIDAWSQYLAM